jgi:hypothetical protein
MKIKTSELIGDALNYAVAIIEYGPSKTFINPTVKRRGIWVIPQKNGGKNHFHPARSNAQGGLLIEREKISVYRAWTSDDWIASLTATDAGVLGPTHLIAAMRCYVASKLGEEVDIPEELLR